MGLALEICFKEILKHDESLFQVSSNTNFKANVACTK